MLRINIMNSLLLLIVDLNSSLFKMFSFVSSLGLGIYVNKSLRLDKLQVYGFDYDYTLAHYSSDLQTLIYDFAKEYMVNEVSSNQLTHAVCFSVPFLITRHCFFQLRYPEICMEFKYDSSFPIRGLYYDKSKGCLMKLDFFGSIEPDGCYYGRRRVFATGSFVSLGTYMHLIIVIF